MITRQHRPKAARLASNAVDTLAPNWQPMVSDQKVWAVKNEPAHQKTQNIENFNIPQMGGGASKKSKTVIFVFYNPEK